MTSQLTPDARFTHILENLGMLGVTQSTMFGRRGMMADGKVIAVYLDDSVAVKLADGTQEHDAAMKLAGAELWRPGGKGVEFKDWVRIPAEHQDVWGRYAEIALHEIRKKL
jgi:TfoX/Sxy family transcriptional regulator of competence genes